MSRSTLSRPNNPATATTSSASRTELSSTKRAPIRFTPSTCCATWRFSGSTRPTSSPSTSTFSLPVCIALSPHAIESLLPHFQQLPKEVLASDYAAVILPAFQFSSSLKAAYGASLSSLQHGCGGGVTSRITPYIPTNKLELVKRVERGEANLANPQMNKHVVLFVTVHVQLYLGRYWYESRGELLQQLRCLNYSTMEPYVIVKRSRVLPLYHPLYYDYGFNKVQFIHHLRYLGYQFYVLMEDFGFDIPHRMYSS